MYNIGILLLIIGGIVVFGADKMYKRGKINTMKQLLIVKSSGLLATILAVVLLIWFKQ